MALVGQPHDLEPGDLDLPCRDLDSLALPRHVVGALAGDLDRRELRRSLHHDAGIIGQQSADRLFRGPLVGALRNRPLEVVRQALFAPCDGELIHLGPVHYVGHGLGRLAQRDRQHPRGQRVQRTGMTGLLGLVEPFYLGDRLGRAHAHRLVEDHPAGNRPALLLAAPGHQSSLLSSPWSRSRATSGERSNSSIFDMLS